MLQVEVHATPGARRNAVGGQHDGRLRVQVVAVADKGKANKAIIQLLAKTFGVPKSAVRLVSGPTHRAKRFEIDGPTDELESILHRLMSE